MGGEEFVLGVVFEVFLGVGLQGSRRERQVDLTGKAAVDLNQPDLSHLLRLRLQESSGSVSSCQVGYRVRFAPLTYIPANRSGRKCLADGLGDPKQAPF